MFTFEAAKYPTASGVYLMKGEAGTVFYVGKAKNLRSRLRSYFSEHGDNRPQIRFLLKRVHDIETIVTDTEKEALILENTLIKKYRPRYNINLRDDKTYLSLRLDPRQEFPMLQLVRRVRRDGALYFGPYASSTAVRATLQEIYRIFPLRRHPWESCRSRSRPCLYYQIGQCSAPCHGKISAEDYQRLVDGALALLAGRESEVVESLQHQMAAAAERMAFEEAARLRDQLRAIEQTVERQKVVEAGGGDQDVVGLHREGGEVELAILFVREGKVIDRRSYNLEWRLDEEELLSTFLQRFYGRDVCIPDRVLLPFLPEGSEVLAEWLSEQRGKKVQVLAPLRGTRRKLVALAARNAEESFRERGSRREARQGVLEEIARRLHLTRFPHRIECFDISNVQGRFSVGSMAVLSDGEPDKGAYRHFRIRSVEGSDDYASLYEVLRRRLERGLREESLPDFILMDGGKGQLNIVCTVLDELNLTGRIDVAGIAKSRVMANVRGKAVERSEERFFLPGRKNSVNLRQGSPALFMLERLRDEAHRFAITHHRKLRRRSTLGSVLEEIPGVGEKRRKALLKHFGSLKAVQAASLDELRAMPGLPAALAERIHAAFQERKTS
ncbi:excinuclease ABC, C subunit [Syntrophotalea carbinolica DSM 2380]|uniref:UvrABC system protein C n=1 Tax=Syntrophotalea carbinolica (strain DSM 2380 / NBRC 103641 / GraBd1) TaxID=338963 RepID=UVRC_SYNC1|nr:excinuclease ABC subunit UvrC [Syntrophotalea carbinolica]Q3A734.1 RecName: Full=UvrABC system protein C; Short=Protein UvrC; AltName: Full=Excinuclease ABC subunit C [Syntrophotalea carbinolica DSM 2380]ABA87813.1 excinuclease ABC, C subunit [Syntrophotalea carbinolica DSM 2380]